MFGGPCCTVSCQKTNKNENKNKNKDKQQTNANLQQFSLHFLRNLNRPISEMSVKFLKGKQKTSKYVNGDEWFLKICSTNMTKKPCNSLIFAQNFKGVT